MKLSWPKSAMRPSSGRRAAPRRLSWTDGELIRNFEGLGDNCEFGVVQRFCNAEPLGLFRFNASRIDSIYAAIATNLEDYFTEDDLDLFAKTEIDEYFARSHRYSDFHYHTHLAPSRLDLPAARARELQKIDFLKRKFREDLASDGKIWVRKGDEEFDRVCELHALLRKAGSSTLLWVVTADDAHPPGSIVELKPGLIRGHVTKFKDFGYDEPLDFENWMKVCRSAWQRARPQQAREVRLQGPRWIASGSDWHLSDLVTGETDDELSRLGRKRPASRLTFKRETSPGDHLATIDVPTEASCDLQPGSVVVFSAWVWIPESFAGSRVDAWFANLPVLQGYKADASRRNVWQRTWVTAVVPRGTQDVQAAVRSSGPQDSAIYISSWTLESGCLPGNSRRPLRKHLGRAIAYSSAAPRKIKERFGDALDNMVPARKPADVTLGGSDFRAGEHVWRLFKETGERLIGQGAFIDADDVLGRGIAAYPADRTLAQLFALSAHNSGRYAEAIPRWEVLLGLAPEDPMCYAGLSANLRELGILERAEALLETALTRFPDDMLILTEAARVASAAFKHGQASVLWDKAIRLHGSYPQWVAARDAALSAASTPDRETVSGTKLPHEFV